VTRRSGSHATNQRAADTRSTRPDVDPPTTVDEFMALLARALDESHYATRMHR
jgi:hypothetical protein